MLCPLLVCLLVLLGIIAPFENSFYDLFTRLRAKHLNLAANVLLIEIPLDKNFIPDELMEARRILANLGAKNVLIIDGHDSLSLEEKARILSLAKTSFISIKDASLSLPLALFGVYREYPLIATDGLVNTAVVTNSDISSNNLKTIKVDFSTGLRGIPRARYEALINKQLIEELVKGKYVLIGHEANPNAPSLITPLSPTLGMSLLEFRGHVLLTLLRNSQIRQLPDAALLCLLLVLTGITAPLYLRWTVKRSTVATLLLLSIFFSISTLLLCVLTYWLPVATICFNQLLLCIAILYSRSVYSYNTLRRLKMHTDAVLSKYYWPKSLVGNSNYWFWQEIHSLAEQFFSVECCVFYEKCPKTSALILQDNEVKSKQGFPLKINVHESPWQQAFFSGQVLKQDPRENATSKGQAYMIALGFAGESLGAWVLIIKDSLTQGDNKIEVFLARVGRQVSYLLHHRQKTLKYTNLTKRLFSTSSCEEQLHKELSHVFEQALGQVDKLQALLDGLGTAAIVFSPFGRVLNINRNMQRLLDDERISPFELNAYQFIATLGQLAHEQARGLVRHVMFDRAEASLPVFLASKTASRFTLRSSPLRLNEKDSIDMRSFESEGILCEIADISAYSQLSELKGLLSQRLGIHIRNDLGTIEMGASILREQHLDTEQRESLVQRIEHKVESITKALADCEQYLAMDNSVQNRERYPVDSRSLLSKAIDETRDIAKEREVEFRIEQPSVMSYAMASSDGLKDVFNALLAIMVADTTDRGHVDVKVIEENGWLSHNLTNSGFGIPQERFREYIYGSNPLASSEFQKLREALCKVESWGGKLEASSELGIGVSLSMRLPRFM